MSNMYDNAAGFIDDKHVEDETVEEVVSKQPHQVDDGGENSDSDSKQGPMATCIEARHVLQLL